MRKATLAIALAVLLAPIAGFTAARWLNGRRQVGFQALSPQPRSALPTVAPTPAPAAATPLYVGDTRNIAAAAIDDTAAMPMNKALIGLARRYLGTPYNAFSLDRGQTERLQLDLTRFDCFLFVEQLLALVNSRQVDTQTEGVNRFTNHVRQLRYEDGRVDYCLRHHYFSRWAEAAERQGYLVNITPFLPGAVSRQRPLTFMSSHADSYEPMQLPANRSCITNLEKQLVVNQSFIPLAQLKQALPSLRSGDIFGLVTRVEGLDVTHVGILEASGGAVDAIHAAQGQGVMRSLDLVSYAKAVPDVIGVMVLRPMPNDDGKPNGSG